MTAIDRQPKACMHKFLFVVVLTGAILSASDKTTVFAKSGVKTIQIDFFWAKDCPHCESAKTLVSNLQKSHQIKVKEFDIDKEADYAAFHRLEATHKRSNLSVPLVVVGKDLLVGESEIKAHLEGRIRTLTDSPNREPQKESSPKKAVRKNKSSEPTTKDKAKPSPDSVKEEWGRMKMTIDEFF